MGAFAEIGNLLIQTLFQFYLLLVLLRLMLQFSRADFYNPVSQFIVKVTNPPLKPLRRVIPGLGGIDFASVVLALTVQLLAVILLFAIRGIMPSNIGLLLLWSLLGCIGMLLNIYFVVLIASIVLSWVAPGSYHPIAGLLHQLAEPVMAPFRRIIPPIGGLDLSPIFVFLAIQAGQILLRHAAAATALPPSVVIGI